MATKSTTTTTTTAITPIAPLEFDHSLLEGDEFRSDTFNVSLGTAQLLNTVQPPYHGLWIPEDQLAKSAWKLDRFPLNHKHKYRGADKAEPGVLFHGYHDEDADYRDKYPSPRIQVLSASLPRIELQNDLTQGKFALLPDANGNMMPLQDKLGNPLGKGAIIGTYDFDNPHPAYKILKEQKVVSLRTIYLIFLLGADNEPLHDLPLKLSVKGANAVSFGEMYSQWQLAFNSAYGAVSGKGLDLTRNEKFYALGVFEPMLGVGSAGEGAASSDVTKVISFTKPTPENLGAYFLGSRFNETMAIIEATKDFDKKYYTEDHAAFHQFLPEVMDNNAGLLPGTETGEVTIDL